MLELNPAFVCVEPVRKGDTYNKRWEVEEATRGTVQLLKGGGRCVSRWEQKLPNLQTWKSSSSLAKKMCVRVTCRVRREERYHASGRLAELSSSSGGTKRKQFSWLNQNRETDRNPELPNLSAARPGQAVEERREGRLKPGMEIPDGNSQEIPAAER